MRATRILAVAGLVVALGAAWPAGAAAGSCAGTATGLLPIPELGAGSYRGEQGGLYPGGSNTPSAAYAAAGARAAAEIAPRDGAGKPDPSGKVVLLSIGMSNTTQEFSAFVGLAKADAQRDGQVVLVDGAQGGRDARAWSNPSAATWTVVEQRFQAAGVTARQVQAIWLKQALAGPTNEGTYVAELERDLAGIVSVAAQRYPNLQQVFVSPRTYAGYASTRLNPEPYAYLSGFSVKRLVAGSVRDPSARPWIGWGPYLWADGATASASGLSYSCADFVQDGTHPSDSGRMKVATLLQKFFDSSELTGWYRGQRVPTASTPSVAPTMAPAAAASPTPVPDLAADPEALVAAKEESPMPAWLALAAVGLVCVAAAVLLLARRS